MNSLQIRKIFFDYFKKHGHTVVPSSSLIPAKDPTLLFTNAGMNQFKDVFLGKETRSYSRAVSIQKCIRAGGKHNDLDNVGFTRRHLTFFEMMGNFSFGNYFKKEAIEYAWDFLTNKIGLKKENLLVSVFEKDNESYNIWNKNIGLESSLIFKLGEEDNFWSMGDTGPCGPCSEIYIDKGIKFGCGKTDCRPGCSCDRFLEIWNLVFIEYDRQTDGSLKELKSKGVDTGMGLERLCSVVQNTDSVFETDLFVPLINFIENKTGIIYKTANEIQKSAFRVLADHIRSSCFAIADGCTPSNEGRGYVLRKIIRRAALFAEKLNGINIFPELAEPLITLMSGIYPELETNSALIKTVLKNEIKKFSTNLMQGQKILKNFIKENQETKHISGEQAFKLYDTYGFPLELTRIIAEEHGFTVDIEGFEKLMEQQRMQSGKVTKEECILDQKLYTHFTGYDEHITHTTITGLVVNDTLTEKVKAGSSCFIITEHSPFYVECGGQVSDQGYIKINDHEVPLRGLKKFVDAIGAYVQSVPIDIEVGKKITLVVDSYSRLNTMKNHTATHLLQSALIEVLGKQVKQSGSVVEPDYLRFDFTYHENLNLEQIILVEEIVNRKIMENIPVKIEFTTLEDATKRGVIAFFGEKYNPERVRIVEIPGFSAELCGGTHVNATGDIGVFKITEVSALSAGNRRIVALTGPEALKLFQQSFRTVKALSQEFKVPIEDVTEAIKKQKEQLRLTQNEIKKLKKLLYEKQIPEWIKKIETISSIPFLFIELEDANMQDLQEIAENLLKKEAGFYFLVGYKKDKSNFIATISEKFSSKINIKEFADWLKEKGIQGGGKATTIQGGASKSQFIGLEEEIKNWIKSKVK